MPEPDPTFTYSSDTASGSNVTIAIEERGVPYLSISGIYGRDDTLEATRVYLTAREARKIGQALMRVAERAHAARGQEEEGFHPREFEEESDAQTALREAAERRQS